ncbi:MAG: hypothetical protein ACOYN5_12015 [Bacteroidales bacterium]
MNQEHQTIAYYRCEWSWANNTALIKKLIRTSWGQPEDLIVLSNTNKS